MPLYVLRASRTARRLSPLRLPVVRFARWHPAPPVRILAQCGTAAVVATRHHSTTGTYVIPLLTPPLERTTLLGGVYPHTYKVVMARLFPASPFLCLPGPARLRPSRLPYQPRKGFLVVATRVRLNEFNHDQLACDVARDFRVAYRDVEALYGRAAMRRIPLFGVGHSLGAKVQVLLNCYPEVIDVARRRKVRGPEGMSFGIWMVVTEFVSWQGCPSATGWLSLSFSLGRKVHQCSNSFVLIFSTPFSLLNEAVKLWAAVPTML